MSLSLSKFQHAGCSGTASNNSVSAWPHPRGRPHPGCSAAVPPSVTVHLFPTSTSALPPTAQREKLAAEAQWCTGAREAHPRVFAGAGAHHGTRHIASDRILTASAGEYVIHRWDGDHAGRRASRVDGGVAQGDVGYAEGYRVAQSMADPSTVVTGDGESERG